MSDGEQDAAICDPAFLRDKQWAVLPSGSPMAQMLQKQFSTGTNAAHPPRWYVRARTNEYGNCTRDACPNGRCQWHVSIFTEQNGAFAVNMEYDLAPKKVR
jgi:hypothetical protein